jgi:hypothetical protein
MTGQRERITHPSWCDRDLCTAPEFRPTLDEYRGASNIGAHMSAPIKSYGTRGELQLSLWQGVTAWDTNTFLAIECEGETVGSIGLGDGQGGIELYALLGQEVKEAVRKWPALYAERFPYVQRAIEDEADEATADASTPRDPVELEEKLAAEALDEGEGPPCGVCGWPAAAHMATADTHNFVVSEFAEDRAAKGCTHPPDEPCFGKRSPLDEVLEGVRERARNLPTVEVTRKAIYPMSYRLTVNGQKHEPYATFEGVRAAVADLVTRRLGAEPERVAAEAGALNAAFSSGKVLGALDDGGDWYTVFDAYGEEPLRIRITVERD